MHEGTQDQIGGEMNKFEFSGVVADISYRDTDKGRITKLTLENHDGRWPNVALIDSFEELSKDVEQGVEVIVYGKISGRAYTNKTTGEPGVFVGLRADTIQVKKDESAVEDDGNLPF